MTPSKQSRQLAHAGLDMDLELAARACTAQLPSLAARRLLGYRRDISGLQAAAAAHSPSAQRLAGKLFSLMANASVHCGGADTLRPLFAHCSLVRAYLWLDRRVTVSAPEPLVRGAPDLVVEIDGRTIWIDTRVRTMDVLAERGRQAALLVDRTVSMRREPPLRLGLGYSGEFHLLDAAPAGKASRGLYRAEQQPVGAPTTDLPWLQALAAAIGARGRGTTRADAGLEHSA